MPPKLILLPGMDGTGELFSPLLRVLSTEIQTVVVRYPDKPLSYLGFRNFIEASLPSDSPYVLLGESFSGPLAISISSENLTSLAGYILVSSFLRCPSTLLRGMPFLSDFYRRTLVLRSVLRNRLLGRYSTPALMDALEHALAQVSDATMRYRLRSVTEVDVSDKLPAVQVPGLYMQASDDRLVSVFHSKEVAAKGMNVLVESIRAPHMLLQVAPVRAAEVIGRFLARIGSRRTQLQ